MKCFILSKPYHGMMALGAICSFRSTTRIVLSKSGKHLIRNKKFLSTVRVNLTKVNITGLEYTNLFEASSLLNINIVKTNYRLPYSQRRWKGCPKRRVPWIPIAKLQKGSFQKWPWRSQKLDSYCVAELTLQWPFRSWIRVCNWAGNNLTTWNMKSVSNFLK